MKLKYGPVVLDARGSVGGVTFSRNHFGPYTRARTTPVNPRTDRQSAVRQAMSDLSVIWSTTLTAAQRTAWNLYGSSVAMLDKLGATIYPTGQNHFIRSNLSWKRQLGLVTPAGPVIFELPPLDAAFDVTASEATQQVSIIFNAALAWVNEDGAGMLVYQGSPQNAQRNFFDGPWRSISAIWGNAAAPPASPYVMAVDFPIAQGQHTWVYARIRRLDGRISEPMRAECFCGA